MRPIITAVLIFASFQSLDCLSGSTTNSRLNYFDIDLLRYVAEGKSGNVMVSPISVKSTLAMLLEGAGGATAAEIKTALRLIPQKDDYRQQLSALMKDLQVHTSNVFVQNANGLFVSKKLPLKKEYEMMVKRLYSSEVTNVDFTDPRTAADVINGWVSTNTKGLIPNIIDQAHITPQSELVITNALYFKGTWLNQFASRPADCFFRDSVCRNVSMMELDAELNYAYVDNLRAHALELPYQGNRHSMILLVPSDLDAGVALIRDLPYIGLLEITSLMRPSDVILTMPKFTVEFGADLVATLKSMKITTLFSRSANLSGIFQDPKASGQLNRIFHKVYMQVDETGTVAAAATAGQVVPLINSFVNLRVDRPFLFFIWDNEKGVVLFEGKIDEPTEVEANNKFANDNGQESVKGKPVNSQVSPDGPAPMNYIPVYQFYPTNPIVGQSVTSQPIQSANQSISVQSANQSISVQSENQSISVAEPIKSANQSISAQPIKSANQSMSVQPIKSANQSMSVQPIQPVVRPPDCCWPLGKPNEWIQQQLDQLQKPLNWTTPKTQPPFTYLYEPPSTTKSETSYYWRKKGSSYYG